MHKTKALALILLLSLLLTACQNPGHRPYGVYLPLAQDKQTDYTIVSYLSNAAPVRSFAVDLLARTGAIYRLVSQPAGKTIYIGTAGQLRTPGAAALSYTEYELWIDETDNLYICMSEESVAEEVLSCVTELVIRIEDGSYGIDRGSCTVRDITSITEAIPVFEPAAGGEPQLHNCGSGNYMARYTGITAGSADSDIAAYDAALAAAGYQLYQANRIGENRFATYIKGDTLLHYDYFAAIGEFRIIYGPQTALFQNVPVTDYEQAVTPSVSIIEGTEDVLCMVVQLADGSFIVIDGGWDSSGWQIKTLNAGQPSELTARYYRDADKDMQVLYDFLKQRAPGGKPRVTWTITHANPDHILLPTRFIREYKGRFDLEMVIYNFPDLRSMELDSLPGMTTSPLILNSCISSFQKAVTECYPLAQRYVYHTGEKLFLPGGEIEFLFTPEDYYPARATGVGCTSGVWRLTVGGRTLPITGDADASLCGRLCETFGSYLASDMLQVPAHGTAGSLAFYQLVDPAVCFWPCQQRHLDHDGRHQGVRAGYEFNAFLRRSQRVTAHYSNSRTHTVLLPSLEEQREA